MDLSRPLPLSFFLLVTSAMQFSCFPLLLLLLYLLFLLLFVYHATTKFSASESITLLLPKSTHPGIGLESNSSKWSWDDHITQSLLPKFENASSRLSTGALLRSFTASPTDEADFIYYKKGDNVTDVKDVKLYIHKISNIQKSEKFINLNLEEFDILRVWAVSSGGNMFSSLVGVQFMVPRGDGLVHVPVTDFNHSSDVRIKLGQSSTTANLPSFVDFYVARATAIDYDVISAKVLETWADKVFVASEISPPPSREHILIRALFSDVGGFTIENGNVSLYLEVVRHSNTTLLITLTANAHIELNWDRLDRKHLTARHVLYGLPAKMKYNLSADVDCSAEDPLVFSILLRVEEKVAAFDLVYYIPKVVGLSFTLMVLLMSLSLKQLRVHAARGGSRKRKYVYRTL